jgi:hypothetical protein
LVKTNWKCTIHKPFKNTTYRMFKELVASQLITKRNISKGKNEAEVALKETGGCLRRNTITRATTSR